MHIGFQFLEPFLVFYTKMLFLIDDEQAEILNLIELPSSA